MEAAKATIRPVDVEKGIFTAVSQLPKQEPRKAALPASAAVYILYDAAARCLKGLESRGTAL